MTKPNKPAGPPSFQVEEPMLPPDAAEAVPPAPPAPAPAVAAPAALPHDPNALLIQALLEQQQQQAAVQRQLLEQLQALQGMVSQQATQLARGPQQLQSAPVVAPALSGGSFDDAEFYWVRIKPANKDQGCTRVRHFCDELGFTARGGTGTPGDIPTWYPVAPAIAQSLLRYHQDDSNPNSPLVFDVVTPEERDEIDKWEEANRLNALGIGSPPSAISLQQAVRQRQYVQAQLPTRRPPPSMLASAALAHQAAQVSSVAPGQGLQIIRGPRNAPPQAVQAAQAPVLPAPAQLAPMQAQPVGVGRMAALPAQPAPLPAQAQAAPIAKDGQVNVSMDFAAEAAASPEIGNLVVISQQVASQAAAELGRNPMRPFSPR